MNRHEFQYVARQFRAGKISLNEFSDRLYPQTDAGSTPAANASRPNDAVCSVEVLLGQLLQRELDSHKGDYGRVLVVAGSVGMAGAAALTGMAALRTGAGLVTVATDDFCRAEVAGFCPAFMTIGLPLYRDEANDSVEQQIEFCCNLLKSRLDQCDVIAIGPGLGESGVARELVRRLVVESAVPVVVDADGIAALSETSQWESKWVARSSSAPMVLTPHEGEMSRLMHSVSGKKSNNRSVLELFAKQWSQPDRIVLLKGHQTMVTDGTRSIYDSSGNPGMATAGSGDVLTGMVAALLGQRFSAFQASVLACHLHGKAGDKAAEEKSQVGMTSVDLIDVLPSVLKQAGV